MTLGKQSSRSKRHSRTSSAFADTPAFSPPVTPPAVNKAAVPFGSPRTSDLHASSYNQYLQPPRSPSPVVHVPAPVPVPAPAPLSRSSPSPSPPPSPTTANTVRVSPPASETNDATENTRPVETGSVAADQAHALPTPSPTPEQATTESESGSQPDSSVNYLPPLPVSRPSSVRSLDPEPLSPGPSSPSSSTAPPARPGLQSPLGSRPGSKFRVVSNRALNTQPARPSPLRPASHTAAPTHNRTLSNASARSFAQPASPSPVVASRMTPSTSAPVTLAPPSRESTPQRLSPGNRNKPLPNLNSVVSGATAPRSATPPGPPTVRATTPSAPSPAPRSTTPVAPIPTPINQSVPYAVLSRATSVSPIPVQTTGNSSITSAATAAQKPAPYRAGFQPKGVYRHRTEEFEAARAKRSDAKRSEEKRLTRRLEKLIDLHFSSKSEKTAPPANRRASSIFDLDLNDFKNKSANELFRGVVETKAAAKEREIRAAEQSITKWEDDKDVSACPICTTSFHPLTNRKHHCRLCGRVVCSLPPKAPTRPVTCSLLIVADPQTHKIEEVPDMIAYGVTLDEKDRQGQAFLKGVRICRTCRGVVSKQQYSMEVATVPAFSRIHQAMIRLEAEIENDLPQFQELVLSVKNGTHPTSTAVTSAARKSLIDRFHEYDRLSKRLQSLPCPPGGSQERVQMAVGARANLFLQKNMFPLQSLPKMKQIAKKAAESESAPSPVDSDSSFMAALDPGHAVQPLLEQEALLEQMLSEAQAARKIEDAIILKKNLAEIRDEIRKIVG
ncbi:Zinc finger, FYVE-type protein [Ceratobasidium sp. AG-Ba]|nr:Zinc finger, FYVE-type protein [Ceratobasidium sp. AG-Ba]